jgi:hypothetical protein
MTPIVAFELTAAERLQRVALNDALECCAFGLVSAAGTRNGHERFVVRELQPVPDSAYISRGPAHSSLAPAFCMELANRARRDGSGILLAHTHPGLAPADAFSPIDDAGERPLREYFTRRAPAGHHFAAVFTGSTVRCRSLGKDTLAGVQLVGADVHGLNEQPAFDLEPRFSRQVLAFGPTRQRILGAMRVAIVGLGGTGSVVATELAHLGVGAFLLIDPDAIEETNLNRVVGATPADLGTSKVELLSRRIRDINPTAICDIAVADIVDDRTARSIIDADFLFLCTDSHASRAVVNQLAYQYLIPCIDMGVAIHAQQGKVLHVVGRIQMLSSGLACLVCAGWIDSSQVRIEMMNPDQRRADAYITGHAIAQPAVISLNGAVASVAITTFLSAVAALPSSARMIHYDAIRGSMTPTTMSPNPQCIVCSTNGSLGRGDTWPLPTRRHAGN